MLLVLSRQGACLGAMSRRTLRQPTFERPYIAPKDNAHQHN